MKYYTHPSYSYVTVVEINKNEVEKVDFATCKQPRETLGSFYNRQTVKPDVLCNAGFFGMSSGVPCMYHIDEGVTRSGDTRYMVGMGVHKGKLNELVFGNVNDGNWNDFLSGYPVLLDGDGPITKFSVGSEINYNAVRMMLGFSLNKIFLVHVGKPGMMFGAMSRIMYNLGCTHAINMDGGGSARCLVNGKVVGYPTENRSVDNCLAIYLKKTPVVETPTQTQTSTEPKKENPPKQDDKKEVVVADAPYILYTVKKGDCWWKIATKHLGNGARYKELLTFNGLKTTTLRVGQVIKLPVDEYTYTVKSGDSWWRIAATQLGNGARYMELAAYNGTTIKHSLHPGDVLKIPT